MKLLSLNLAAFEKNNSKLKKYFAENSFDIICLQEVIRQFGRDADPEFVKYDTVYNATTNLPHQFYSPYWLMDHFAKANFHGQDLFHLSFGDLIEFGYLTKSTFKIFSAKNVFIENDFTYVTDWSNWPETDYRSAQVVDYSVAGDKKLRTINIHGRWSKNKAGNEITLELCKKIKNLALEVGFPCIICGDFNLFPDTESMQVFQPEFESLVDTYHIKSTRPASNELSNQSRNAVDYMLVSKGITVNDFQVEDSDVSDHLPLILDFDLD